MSGMRMIWTGTIIVVRSITWTIVLNRNRIRAMAYAARVPTASVMSTDRTAMMRLFSA